MQKSSLVILFLILLIPVAIVITRESPNTRPEVLETMQLQRYFGQMLCIGMMGTSLDENPGLREQIEGGMVGTIILFRYNTGEGFPELMRQLQEIETEFPLWIMVDQEGGKIERVPDMHCISPQEMAETKSPQQAFEAYRKMATQLRDYGFTNNLGPVVDLDINPNNPIIGHYGRSFSADPDVVYDYARSFIDAHREQGLLTCIKHYPGHGSADKDTHLDWTDVTLCWSTAERDIFKRLIDNGYADMIMTSHIFHSGIDDRFPASMSEKHVREIIREKWGYDGVIITDDLLMNALCAQYDVSEIVTHTINADNDMVLFGNIDHSAADYVEEFHRVIRELVESEKISMTELEESFNRVTRLKQSRQQEI